jgi:hypothetical protein
MVFVVVFACAAEAQVRTWTDATGKYSIEAELVGIKDGKVQLRRADGRGVAIALEKLSAADQEYVKRHTPGGAARAEEPAEPAADDAPDAPKPVWMTDLAKMRIPRAKVTGQIHGREFAPERAELSNGVLTLHQGKDFFPDLALSLFLFLKEGESVEGKKFRVAPTARYSSPHVHVQWREKPGDSFPQRDIIMDGYAMILEFGKKASGKIPGRIYLSLPDKQRSFAAGSFTVVFDDETSEPGTGDIAGKVTLAGAAPGGWLNVDCLGKNPKGDLECPGAGIKLDGSSAFANSTTWKPRNSLVRWDQKTMSGIHKHINRPPGAYLVLARASHNASSGSGMSEVLFDGYFDAKWVQIKAAGESVAADLSIEPEAMGALEITVRGGSKERAVVCVPLDAQGQLPLPGAVYYLQSSCGAKLENGKAVVRFLREGKYQVAIGPWQPGTLLPAAKADVEVKRGQTARVELTPVKPDATPR